MSTIGRTLTNLRKVGIKDYFKQMLAGVLIGTDRAGNKYFENNEELPLRTRWVEYAVHDYDAAHIEPGWHAWMSYSDAMLNAGTRAFEPSRAIPNFTQTRGAFKTYNTAKPKMATWQPVAAPRE
ncbi:NADH dehydrogenase [ubiquinone] 1 alpha subcomplex subunit N7BM [Fusarium culmorum]|uniref:NADH dehydrogenase [ubiquinone] 1 alpha subcomplex subunit n=1 Tax=Fusarium culmorum TaxID=5516 RepID=A0A2T4GFT4_FUSCU|nr:NADH dehydrogenase [ubiquinone] 1 alpha subcomplex subunit N7BM [Fusarium culmorum]